MLGGIVKVLSHSFTGQENQVLGMKVITSLYLVLTSRVIFRCVNKPLLFRVIVETFEPA